MSIYGKEVTPLYSNMPRDDAYKACLMNFIRRAYDLEPISLTPAKRGFFGETWRLGTAKAHYFLKLDYSAHQSIYAHSFPIIAHLCNHGIDFISKIVCTTQGELCARFDGAVLGVFDWIDGENIENDDTKPPEYQMLAQIYAVPAEGLDIPREDFSSGVADQFYDQWDRLKRGPANEIVAMFEQSREKITHRAGRLRFFSDKCKGDTSGFVITHGDAGGNVLVDGDRYFIVDWDYAMLAPPERDAWVMCCREVWAQELFHNTVKGRGIGYTLRPERLAFYAYHFFFYYLTEFLSAFFCTGSAPGLTEYLIEPGWVEGCFQGADKIQP
ncbi:MAG: aminoglycoside phosphotransferase family protein [Clostridia bacterium]|nr:aminoglycoside phosphotransferase family protein [Clostridia bacterium]